jgi:hypothetical protein
MTDTETSKVTPERKAPIRPTAWQIARTSRWVKAGRVAVFGSTLAVVMSGVGYSRVRGQVGEQMLDVGELLMRYEAADRQDTPRELHFNGQTLMFTSGTTQDSRDEVLSEFERRCNVNNEGVLSRIREVAPSALEGRHLTLRERRGEAGAVACLDYGEGVSATEFIERANRFRESHDMEAFGHLRYVYVEPTPHGGSHFLTFWTTGSFDFDEVTGDQGNRDVPGEDLASIPRPPRSLRTIDFSEAGTDQHVLGYGGSSMTHWELGAFYREELPRRGYRLMPAGDNAPETEGIETIAAERDGRMDLVVVGLDRYGLGQVVILTGGS